MNEYRLKIVVWENGEGLLVRSVGWDIGCDIDEMTLAATLERVSNADCVPGAITRLPIANIHSEEILNYREMA